MNQLTRSCRGHRGSRRRCQQRGLSLGAWRSHEVVGSGRVPFGSVVTALATDVDCLPERPDRNQVDIRRRERQQRWDVGEHYIDVYDDGAWAADLGRQLTGLCFPPAIGNPPQPHLCLQPGELCLGSGS